MIDVGELPDRPLIKNELDKLSDQNRVLLIDIISTEIDLQPESVVGQFLILDPFFRYYAFHFSPESGSWRCVESAEYQGPEQFCRSAEELGDLVDDREEYHCRLKVFLGKFIKEKKL